MTLDSPTVASPADVVAAALLVEQLVESVVEVTANSARLRRLLVENAAVIEDLALPSLHRRIATAARSLVPTPAAALAVLTERVTVSQVVQLDDAEPDAGFPPVSEEGLAALTALLRPLVPGSVARASATDAVDVPPLWSEGFAAVPVHYRRDVLAVLLLREEPPGLTSEDEAVLLSLAVTAGTAIENARTYEEAQRRQEWLEEAAELSSGALAMTAEAEAVHRLSRSVHRLADAELVLAWVPRSAADPWEVETALGEGSERLAGCTLPTGDPLVAEVLQCGRTSTVSELTGLERSGWSAGLGELGVGPVMLMPVPGARGVRALLVVGRRCGRAPFSAFDLEMAETFLDRVGVAIDLLAARALEQRLAVLKDRERIARDLHDHVIQSLFATALTLQRAAGTLPDHPAQRLLHEAVGDIDSTIRQLRTSIFQLGSEEGSGLAPRAAVLAVVAQVRPLLGFEPLVDFVGPVDTAVHGALVEEVVAVVREAMTNTAKHASATALEVRVLARDGLLRLEVVDDGVGLGGSSRRSGLANLRHRARRLGGTLAVSEPSGGGTALAWSVPLTG